MSTHADCAHAMKMKPYDISPLFGAYLEQALYGIQSRPYSYPQKDKRGVAERYWPTIFLLAFGFSEETLQSFVASATSDYEKMILPLYRSPQALLLVTQLVENQLKDRVQSHATELKKSPLPGFDLFLESVTYLCVRFQTRCRSNPYLKEALQVFKIKLDELDVEKVNLRIREVLMSEKKYIDERKANAWFKDILESDFAESYLIWPQLIYNEIFYYQPTPSIPSSGIPLPPFGRSRLAKLMARPL